MAETSSRLIDKMHPMKMMTRLVNPDLEGVAALPLRDDDVILCSYPRTGTHWMWEQMRMVLAGSTDLPNQDKEDTMLSLHTDNNLQQVPSPRVLNSHLQFKHFPREVLSRKTKLAFIYRDPKDQVVSFYTYLKGAMIEDGTFEEFVEDWKSGAEFLYGGSYANWLREWEGVMNQHPEIPVFVASYEQLKQDPLPALRQLAAFLGVKRDDAFLMSVAEKCGFDQMKTRKEDYWKSYPRIFNGLYRKGQAGGWREWFTDAVLEDFNTYWTQQTKDLKVFTFPKSG